MKEADRITSLSKLERLILANQLRILEQLCPEEAGYFANHRTAIEEGYTLHYKWLFEHLDDELSVDDCREVLDILEMYRAITFSYDALSEEQKREVPAAQIKFSGFDGNSETRRMAYVRYFVLDLDRYRELRYNQENPAFDSHLPKLETYRLMLEEWRKCADQQRLTREDLIRILKAQ